MLFEQSVRRKLDEKDTKAGRTSRPQHGHLRAAIAGQLSVNQIAWSRCAATDDDDNDDKSSTNNRTAMAMFAGSPLKYFAVKNVDDHHNLTTGSECW